METSGLLAYDLLMRHSFILAPLFFLGTLFVAACPGDSATEPTATPPFPQVASPTFIPYASPTATSTPTSPLLDAGQVIEVAAYRAYPGVTPECADILEQIVPDTARSSQPYKVKCEVTRTDQARITYTNPIDGLIYLSSVMMIVHTRANTPQFGGLPDCNDIDALLVRASEPTDTIKYVAACSYTPPPPDKNRTDRVIWAAALIETQDQELAGGDCLRFVENLAATTEAQTKPLPCVLR